ncbi:7,8-didemethyl-8-hydroxy-5-deazariboflavin synthase subunit CofG [Oxynema sp. CENA135]|uniref:7,8-didemethyl-8-hydroxy-5-deazariboflavin synthase subunit CofG n=1 Tax=Oxynema sp. CENA135 TaxID=984206 RepID=UPI00190CA5D0|nr:7,8-didemethyl-8-hydroxy-5-deazariboflavin synthase subunit CofG [Oxynema sp. CENA135]MBK4732295.1 7,8-didemethyl-8-hydroxy-5-deazariboflavin synthase subunit CofG [Oxynema sp. CENA135]
MNNISSAYNDRRLLTYSPAYTVVPTYECFNRCSYCNFRRNPGESPWLSLEEARVRLEAIADRGVIEVLILSGEVHPGSSRRSRWIRHLHDLGQLALDLGFLPHTNAGPLSYEEMAQLKQVNVSMGLMLEQVTPQLLETVHRHAPSKVPTLRLQQLEWAGELRIPLTTGLLLGIGESPGDRRQTLEAIARVQQQWGHIQEVILQPHRPGSRQQEALPGFDDRALPDVVAMARAILPENIRLQIPPNLVAQPDILLACIEAGARDLGGIGPHDEVNPDYPHPAIAQLSEIVEPLGWHLDRRLPVYPAYYRWLTPSLKRAVDRWNGDIGSALPVN